VPDSFSLMPLKNNMTLAEILMYLTGDLKVSIINDIGPCLSLGYDEGGYFAAPRLVLSYVDYLGALYHGYEGKSDSKNRRIFADPKYAKNFLSNVFGRKDDGYKKYGDLLWEIYRNGTIHLYSPKSLKDIASKRTVGWLIHKLERKAQLRDTFNEGMYFTATHLKPYDHGNGTWTQPISIKCMYEDLIYAIDRFAQIISTDHNLESKFRSTSDALSIPETTLIEWWKNQKNKALYQ